MHKSAAIDFLPESHKTLVVVSEIMGSADESVFLPVVADRLRCLLSFAGDLESFYRKANEGEELVYRIATDPKSGITLYLISDGPRSISPPHEHLTWSVIVGLDGVEENTVFEPLDQEKRTVRICRTVSVGPGESIFFDRAAIHGTKVVGQASTYHLHLYGKPLESLPPFASRIYCDV
jgi:predicted metal-dependent enzyme (double-stranded beta helix superfamily)